VVNGGSVDDAAVMGVGGERLFDIERMEGDCLA
jgi:hypothetical protein